MKPRKVKKGAVATVVILFLLFCAVNVFGEENLNSIGIVSNEAQTAQEPSEDDVIASDALRQTDENSSLTFQSSADTRFTVNISDEEKVNSYSSNGIIYLFLPVSADLSSLIINSPMTVTNTEAGTISEDGYSFSGDFTDKKEFKVTLSDGNIWQIKLMQSSQPSLSITLNGTTLAEINSNSKDIKYKKNTVALSDGTSTSDYSKIVEIKGRGNTSWLLEKKPYQLKFQDPVSLLGMPEAKKWTLIANYADGSLLRNKTGYDLASSMNMTGSPQSRFIDLWVDGDYQGSYILCQKIDINAGSVNLSNEGGVLVELDNNYYSDEDTWFASSKSNSYFVLKEYNSESAEIGAESFGQFENKISQFEAALYEEDKNWALISSLIDTESFAKYYLYQEFTGNWDAMAGSTYMFMDGASDTIHLGPVWDMDLSLGNQIYQDVNLPWVTNNRYRTDQNTWMKELLKIPEFQQLVQKIYSEEAADAFEASTASVQSNADAIALSAEMNFIRWPVLGTENPIWAGNRICSTFQSNVDTLISWMSERSTYMNKTLLGTHVFGSAHVQNIGWLDQAEDTDIIGTTGQNNRLEAVKLYLTSSEYEGGIKYSGYVQDIGWQNTKQDNALCGTTGQERRLEAVKIELTGELADHYDIYYRTHCENLGWMNWAMNGEESGTVDFGLKVEAVQIKLVPRGEKLLTDDLPAVTYSKAYSKAEIISVVVHGQDYGWSQGSINSNQLSINTAGTTGLGKRIEALRISDNNPNLSFSYQVHIQNFGWTNRVYEGAIAGTTGQGLRLEAIRIWVSGADTDKYNVQYRVHCEDYGWMNWMNIGETAGTEGQAKRIEAIEIRVSDK